MRNLPKIVIVGRPNVGKSSLFNRILGRRAAVVSDREGVTRDRHFQDVSWDSRRFTLVDTGGYLPDEGIDPLAGSVRAQISAAVDEASVVLFLVDGIVGLTELDMRFAKVLRGADRPVVLVVNKSENPDTRLEAWDFLKLGFGEPFMVSAVTGYEVGNLLSRVIELVPADAWSEGDRPGESSAERSDDEFSNTLFFIVDDVHAESPTLQAAYILVRDTTNPSAKLVSFPLNTKMLAGESNVTLQTHFDYAGPAACIVPLTTAANIHVSHAVAATDRIFDQLENLKGSTIPVLLSSATDELETIQSDYHTSELLGLANALREIGFENIVRLDAPYNEETFEDGTLVANIDHQKLCRDVGLFIETEPAPEPEPAPEEGQDEEGSEGEYYEEYWY